MKTATPERKAERLLKLAKKAETLVMFIKEAQKFPRHYGFPGMGTVTDWKTFYEGAKRQTK